MNLSHNTEVKHSEKCVNNKRYQVYLPLFQLTFVQLLRLLQLSNSHTLGRVLDQLLLQELQQAPGAVLLLLDFLQLQASLAQFLPQPRNPGVIFPFFFTELLPAAGEGLKRGHQRKEI